MPMGFTGHVRAPNKNFLQRLSAAKHRALQAALVAQVPPPAWDSRTQGWVGPIKDQSQCGSCWDFSGTCVVEVAYYKAGVLPADGSAALSEEYTLSCGRNGGCNGDDNVNVLEWAKSTGIPSTADYGSYTAQAGHCNWKQGMKLYKIDDWGFVDGQQGQGVTDATAIKNAIMQYGCVGSAVAAGGDSFWNNGTGIGSGTSHNIDHDVVITGWDDSKGSTKTSAAVGPANVGLPSATVTKTVWDMRNSWNTSWGNQGYAWVREGAYDLGTEAVWAVINASAPPIDYFW